MDTWPSSLQGYMTICQLYYAATGSILSLPCLTKHLYSLHLQIAVYIDFSTIRSLTRNDEIL